MKLTTMTSIAALLIAGTACAQETALETDTAAVPAEAEAFAQEDVYGTDETLADETVYGAEDDVDFAEELDDTDPLAGDDTYLAESGPISETAIAEEDALAEARDEFASADMDGDGQLNRDEFLAAMAAVTVADAPLPEGDAMGDELGDQNAFDTAEAQDPSEYLVAKFQAIAGEDEAVTLAELEEDRRADFETADADGDDVLEGEEVQTFAQLKSGQDAASSAY
jgi:hypothetical protein